MNGVSQALTQVYDPTTGTWALSGSMNSPRDWLALTVLADGRVLAAGGLDLAPGGHANPILTSADLSDPRLGTWATTGSMGQKRWGMTAVTLADGTVLIAGGANASGECQYNPTAETYDPQSGTWHNTTGEMAVKRGFYNLTLLGDGSASHGSGLGRVSKPLAVGRWPASTLGSSGSSKATSKTCG